MIINGNISDNGNGYGYGYDNGYGYGQFNSILYLHYSFYR